MTLNWGILGTGNIARAFAAALRGSQTGKLVAAASRTEKKAKAFAHDFNARYHHGRYEELLANDDVQAVYIATPHPTHMKWAMLAAQAGKHILCEKPIAINAAQALAIFETARQHNVFCMEAFMYRCHPQTTMITEIIRNGGIGALKLTQATFSFRGPDDPASRLMDPALGGGGILDVGCYPLSLARLAVGASRNRPFADGFLVEAVGRLGQTGVDEYTAALLDFGDGVIAQISCGIRLVQDNVARIYGTDGWMEIPSPWIPGGREPGAVAFKLHRAGQESQQITVDSTQPLYAMEADVVGRAIAAGKREADEMCWADTLGNMRALDRWRDAIELVYEEEKPRPTRTDIFGQPIKVRAKEAGHKMKYGQIAGVDKPVSKLVMGAIPIRGNYPRAGVLFDHWLSLGGNTIDAARIYHHGQCDIAFGQWLKSRGVREELVIIEKGAHTPNCNPIALASQLHESLDLLHTDYVDVYMLHRDNPDVPVGEFVDAFNELVDAGRVRVFGASNWSIERFLEANDYAKRAGKRPMTVLSNNLSLAQTNEPIWPGTMHVSDQQSRDWLQKTQTVHLSWSSQARGFFTDRAGPDKRDNPEFVRFWYSEANFARRQRAYELAEKKGVQPINIAAAYVLCQPFPSFAAIGPETLEEMNSSLGAMDVELTREEVDWLWSGPRK